ncbi:hypothetical protein FRX31_011626 [Thalictrum thalictroides]|uniref:Uncharacterized protein n=1 Tax=Thalictrum thalictroides TaxID=46969 RepID=A0A7J6WPB2_THATH|nr:hypothetical protein FRX31_011626 [Thalictrum thalictroides]
MSHTLKPEIFNTLQMNELNSEELYLGTPLFLGQKKTTKFYPLIKRIEKSLAGWKRKTLYQVERTVLINSVTSAVPS